jgi:XTP/dITP diphosphohydrolase
MEFIFATHNRHKAEEIRAVLDEKIKIITLDEAGISSEIPEPFETLHENASAKSGFIFQATGRNCFSEDTGLEVDALGGAPGVHSARYAGEGREFDENMDKLLLELGEKADRTARFRTVISLILDGKEYFFEGVCEGRIGTEKMGKGGFGYDPIFYPGDFDKTFAQMDILEKSLLSHRGIAVGKLVTFLNNLITNR